MKRNRWIKFFLAIFMFFTMIGVNEYHHEIFSKPMENEIQEANRSLITSNPTAKMLYVIDPKGVLHTDVPKEPGAVKATVEITHIFSSNEFIYIDLYDNGTNIYTGDFSKVNPPVGGLLGVYLTITYTHADGTSESTEPGDISGSINDALQNDYSNQDALIVISRDANNKLILSSDTNIFEGQKYLFYAYQIEPGDTVYCEYSNGDGNNYFIPMVKTGYRYGDKQLPVYRACIYASKDAGGYFFLNSVKFKIIKHTEIEDPNARINAIISKTYAGTWDGKIYYKTVDPQHNKNNWKEFYTNIFESYTVTFYMGTPDKEGNDKVHDQITGIDRENDYLITVPSNPLRSGYTFLGWKKSNSKKIEDFTEGDNIFVTETTEYVAVWHEGYAFFLHLQPAFVKKIHGDNYNPTSFELYVSEDASLSNPKKVPITYNFNTNQYQAIITLTGKKAIVSKVGSARISYKVNGVKYQSNVMQLTDTITSDTIKPQRERKCHLNYHVIVPEDLNINEDGTTVMGYSFEKLFKIIYHYGANFSIEYNRLPVSIGIIRPLFIEREGYTLEGWYTALTSDKTAVDESTRFEHQKLKKNIHLYANHVSNRDYYFYIDNYQNREWQPTSITMYNDYFLNHKTTIDIPSEFAKNLGHNIYQVELDISKSYSDFFISGKGIDQTVTYRTKSAPLDTEYTYFDITSIKQAVTVDGKKEQQNVIHTEIYGDCLVGAQKLPYDSLNKKNAFRFAIGVPNSIKDYYQDKHDPTKPQDNSQTNLGFKVVFISNDSCYIGFWNFNPQYRLDYIRFGPNELHKAGVKEGNHTYAGFYALTIRDDISFHYKDFDHILIIGVYKSKGNKLKVVKATEYQIVTREQGNVDIYYQDNHIVNRGI